MNNSTSPPSARFRDFFAGFFIEGVLWKHVLEGVGQLRFSPTVYDKPHGSGFNRSPWTFP